MQANLANVLINIELTYWGVMLNYYYLYVKVASVNKLSPLQHEDIYVSTLLAYLKYTFSIYIYIFRG